MPELILLHLLTINYARRRMNQSRFNVVKESVTAAVRISIKLRCKRWFPFRSISFFFWLRIGFYRLINMCAENESGVRCRCCSRHSALISCRLLNFIFACVLAFIRRTEPIKMNSNKWRESISSCSVRVSLMLCRMNVGRLNEKERTKSRGNILIYDFVWCRKFSLYERIMSNKRKKIELFRRLPKNNNKKIKVDWHDPATTYIGQMEYQWKSMDACL